VSAHFFDCRLAGLPASVADVSVDVAWIHGVPRGRAVTDPPIQVHEVDGDTFMLRQSKSLSYEAPFLYLLLGDRRAILFDTGATADPEVFPLRATVDDLIERWLAAHPRPGYELVVAHTHAHGDHVAADAQFADRPSTTVVGTTPEEVEQFFAFAGWPAEVVRYDLGGRVLDVTGSPGHHRSAISVFDPVTGFLLTGDTVYPGRLYVFDYPAFVASLDRLVAFAEDRPVSHIMGCHIEMNATTGRDYPLGATYQPDEPPLQMTVEQLRAVRDAAVGIEGRPGIHAFDGFVIVNGVGVRTTARLYARALAAKLRRQ
jgi:hydroxyacylglutathione hydrolase